MNSSKVLCCVAGAAGVLATYLLLENASLRERNALLLGQLERAPRVHGATRPVLVDAPPATKRDGTGVISTGEEEPLSSGPTSPMVEAQSNFTVVRALWADPQFRAASFEQALLGLEARYGRFFLTLRSLPAEKVDAIKVLLATQRVDLARMSIPEADPETPTALQQRLARIKTLEQTQEAELRATMGSEVFERFRESQHTESYRETMEAVANGMRAQGFTVDDAQQEKMLHVYAAAMKATAEIAQREDGAVNVAQLTPDEQSALRERQMRRMQLHLATAMAGIIEGPALDVFIATQVARDYRP